MPVGQASRCSAGRRSTGRGTGWGAEVGAAQGRPRSTSRRSAATVRSSSRPTVLGVQAGSRPATIGPAGQRELESGAHGLGLVEHDVQRPDQRAGGIVDRSSRRHASATRSRTRASGGSTAASQAAQEGSACRGGLSGHPPAQRSAAGGSSTATRQVREAPLRGVRSTSKSSGGTRRGRPRRGRPEARGGVAGQRLMDRLGGEQVGQRVLVAGQGRAPPARARPASAAGCAGSAGPAVARRPGRAWQGRGRRRTADGLTMSRGRLRRRCRWPSRRGRVGAQRSDQRVGRALVKVAFELVAEQGAERLPGPDPVGEARPRPGGGARTGRWRRWGRLRRRARGGRRAGRRPWPPARSRRVHEAAGLGVLPQRAVCSRRAASAGSTADAWSSGDSRSTTPQPPRISRLAWWTASGSSLSAAMLSAHAVQRWVARSRVSGSRSSSSIGGRAWPAVEGGEGLVEGRAAGRGTAAGCATATLPRTCCR